MFVTVIKTIFKILTYAFVVYTLLYTTNLVVNVILGWSSIIKKKKQKEYKYCLNNKVYLPVSLIVPAYNESLTIVDSINSLLKLDYTLFEIVVVDDGSKDNTSEMVINAFNMHKLNRPIHKSIECKPEEFVYVSYSNRVPITLIRKENGGCKADATNMGINACKYPYFICMDADSVLQSDSLKEIVAPVLENEDVVAVGGTIKILNDCVVEDGVLKSYRIPKNWLAALQVVEYDRTFASAKFFYNKIKGNALISGAFGLFKKDVVIKAGGYDKESMGEDMDLVMSLSRYCSEHNESYTIDYVPDAICWTQGPEKFKDIKSQRRRWHLGFRQNLRKHKKMILNRNYGTLGMVTLPSYILFELLSPFIEIIGFIGLVASLIFNTVNWVPVVAMTVLYAIFGIFSSLVAYASGLMEINRKITFGEVLKVIGMCFFELFFMHPYLLIIRFAASFKKPVKQEWVPIERKKLK